MSNQTTLSIIKPDAVKAGHVDAINIMIESSGLKILEKKELNLLSKWLVDINKIYPDFKKI